MAQFNPIVIEMAKHLKGLSLDEINLLIRQLSCYCTLKSVICLDNTDAVLPEVFSGKQ